MKMQPCPDCNGSGWTDESWNLHCYVCDGTGTLPDEPVSHCQACGEPIAFGETWCNFHKAAAEVEDGLTLLINRCVNCCRQRNPEALDRIFDTLNPGYPLAQAEHRSSQVIHGIVTQLHADLDTLSWFCGYMASEINRSGDRADLPITQLSKILIEVGLVPFVDFVPYMGQRIAILQPEKFAALPDSLHQRLQAAFDFTERSAEELEQINEAIRQEYSQPEGDIHP
ncbi:MAG TPA: hypothetical protein V6C65_24290 [Allocoleopsis sp.]